MSWQAEWKRLRRRIESLLETGRFMFATAKTVGSDFHGISQFLIQNGHETAEAILEFEKKYGAMLPPPASTRLLAFTKMYKAKFRDRSVSGWSGLQGVLALIGSFSGEFDYLLSDTEVEARSFVDRAFLHLQRSLVADPIFAERWQSAFEKGERACERLGAAHLLQFGIYAFKADSAGEQTDLILGGRVPVDEVRRGAETLVLTEWKLIRKPGDLPRLADSAYEQAKRYASGSLAGFELEHYRYLVLVSKDVLILPQDRVDDGIIYQFRNVAVEPSSPSKAR
jgi:hypothetical protein